jgi:hypothetical protein
VGVISAVRCGVAKKEGVACVEVFDMAAAGELGEDASEKAAADFADDFFGEAVARFKNKLDEFAFARGIMSFDASGAFAD